ncbi:MAG: dephospho-CoA kinase [Francisellaceae bacterium]|jgi:dephospho-CoA kinase
MYIVGLTGGIASGKSTVLTLFNNLDIDTFCADKTSKDIVMPRTTALNKIINRYSNDILLNNQTLNRRALKTIIFNDVKEKKWLENLIHPLVKDQLYKYAQAATSPYCILDIPLLNKHVLLKYQFINKVITLETNSDLQIKRLIKRDKITESLAKKIISSQATNEERREISDFNIINNQENSAQLTQKVEEIHQQLLKMIDT